MTRRRTITLLTLLPLAVCALVGAVRLWPRPTLVLWSCGGNYELLRDYVTAFEAKEKVRVRYTAAPAAFLLARALDCSHPPDVIVGRGGPGWDALQDVGRAAGPPLVFASDPLVIAVVPGNPCHIESVEDLGRADVRVSLSPGAMRPKSKVPAMFMAAVSEELCPGLVERWENQAVSRDTCGRRLLDPLLDGTADAALAPRSLLFYPAYAGRVEEIPIPAATLLAMPSCPAIPQCGVVLGNDGQKTELAQRFLAGLATDTAVLARHGYVPVGDPRSQEIGPLLKAMSPKDMPGWQTFLAESLATAGVHREARRRFLQVLYVFGPSRYAEHALCRVAAQSSAEGRIAAARLDWQRVLDEFPPDEPVEYDLPTSPQKASRQPIQELPHEHWREEAEAGLRQCRGQTAEADPILQDPLVRELFPVRVTQGDPPKNGTRDLGLGLHEMVVGELEYATRDLLKVVTLHYPSRHMATAEYLLGLCAEGRGLPEVAWQQWERTVRDYPGTHPAELAAQALHRLPAGARTPPMAMPPWTESFATAAERGMTYGMRLHAHHLPLFTTKEMLKLICGIYGKHSLGGETRFRAGVACQELGNLDAAVRQWRSCLRDAPDSPWAEASRQALVACGREAIPLPGQTPPPAKGSLGQRFRLAEELNGAGLTDEGQPILEYLKVLTVARPPAGKLSPQAAAMLQRAQDQLAACLAATGQAPERTEQLLRSLPPLPPANGPGKKQPGGTP